jgi:multicomponent Na+:H+ antiporter subunit B
MVIYITITLIMLHNFLVLKKMTLFILPYIFLYSIYVQINGEISPGGGFQAGVIFASCLIGFDLIHNNSTKIRYFNHDLLIVIAALGVFIYASIGAISFYFGKNYLNYDILAKNKLHAQSIGIFIVEIGVGLTVASVMYLIYSLLQNNKNK